MNKQEELLERLKIFAISFVGLIRDLPRTETNKIYGNQGIRSTSSVGANYSEATCAHTKADFIHDLNKCRKEAKESMYWLELLLNTNPDHIDKIKPILAEGQEIFKIFMSAVKTTRANMDSAKNLK